MSQVENRRLLIVDDEPEIRSGYKSILSPEQIQGISSSRVSTESPLTSVNPDSFEIVEAENGAQALRIFQKYLNEGLSFAGAFVDVRMPGQPDGLQFIQEAWKQDPNLLVVVVTAYQDRSVDEIHRMFSQRFQDQWDYLNKPFSSGEIVQKARYLVSSWNRRAREKEYLWQIKEHQDALVSQESLAAVGRLARSIGHEFGNILQPLVSLLDLTQEQVRSGDLSKVECSIDEMIETVTLGATICQDLLTFARETPKHPIDAVDQKIFIAATLQKTLRLLRHELHRKDVQVSVDVPDELQISIHEPRMIQVLVNLFKNALDALPDGGKIEVQGRMKSDTVVLEIKDNGSGVSPEALTQLFQPLFSTKGDRGNGIGLTACKQIVEKYQGQISITSVQGEGATVSLSFPSV